LENLRRNHRSTDQCGATERRACTERLYLAQVIRLRLRRPEEIPGLKLASAAGCFQNLEKPNGNK